MIIRLKNATFTTNIGTLDSWSIKYTTTNGSVTKKSGDTSIKKDDTDGEILVFEFDTAKYTYKSGTIVSKGVSAGTISVSGNTITVNVNAGSTLGGKVEINFVMEAIGGGEPVVPVTTTFFGTDVTIVSDPSELNYVAGKMAGTGTSGFGDKIGRACSITQCLEVSGGSTVVLNQVINGVTLKYSIREFNDLPLSADTKTANGQDATSWLTTNQKLQSATKYIVICANRGTDTNFNASELELLKQAFTIS